MKLTADERQLIISNRERAPLIRGYNAALTDVVVAIYERTRKRPFPKIITEAELMCILKGLEKINA